jgi:hypothetical protein
MTIMTKDEKALLEKMVLDFIGALKLGDIDSAIQFVHPDDRAETEESLRDGGLEGTLEDLPDGDPEFEWIQGSRGEPIIDLTNSKAKWGMGWACVFRDGRWWLD